MKKLALRLDDLEVDTFTTAERTGGKGTVRGHYGATHTQGGETCWASCFGTCGGDTCDYTCPGYATTPGGIYPCVLC
ncbi:MAG TPA: hypothetical protein VFR37_19445 [Longimicrobium sp.]|nr:hypothetical protein [Longimicrobium sp.]